MAAINGRWQKIPQCKIFQCDTTDSIPFIQQDANEFAIKISNKYQVTDIIPCAVAASNGFAYTITVVYEIFKKVEESSND